MGTRRSRPSAQGQRTRKRSAKVAIAELRDGIGHSEQIFRQAENAEHRRAGVIDSLYCVLLFFSSLDPPIVSTLLFRHFETLAELFVGRQDESLKPSKGKPLLDSPEKRERDGLIAAAVAILSQGGARRGNLSRSEACMRISNWLNEEGARDRGNRFTSNRAKNIYLEVTKLAQKKTAPDGGVHGNGRGGRDCEGSPSQAGILHL
jgi:hypothetical protein